MAEFRTPTSGLSLDVTVQLRSVGEMVTKQLLKKSSNSPVPNHQMGRPKGIPNRTTTLLKDAILRAAELSGQDTKGKGGLVGYLHRVADEDVKAFSSLLGRVLPLQLTGAGGGPIELTIEGLLRRIAENGESLHKQTLLIEHKPEAGDEE